MSYKENNNDLNENEAKKFEEMSEIEINVDMRHIIVNEYDDFELFKPFEYIFYFLKENKDVLLKNIK